MDHEDRDRRDWPAEDGGTTDPDARPDAADATSAPADPKTDADRASDDATAWPSGTTSSEPGWPTEPPAAGSAPAESWPTSAPERGDEVAWSNATAEPTPHEEPPVVADAGDAPVEQEPSRFETAPMDAPPPEVEAYPAAEPATSDDATAAHAVPAAASVTGESTQCPRCGTENRPGLAFCRNCGQRLVAAGVASTVQRPGTPEGTQACPRCGTHNRAGVAFCQNCGANLRGTSEGYVPPAAATEGVVVEPDRRGAVLGPVVLLIGLVGIITAYLLPFLYGTGSLFDRAIGSDGYGVAFWSGYPDVGAALVDQAYFGLAAPSPILAILLLGLSVAGFVRAVPGLLQTVGLAVALAWSVGLVLLFVVVELLGSAGGDLVAMLRDLSPAGIIFFLSGLIVVIGVLTRFGRS
jgi:hypothetical protein